MVNVFFQGTIGINGFSMVLSALNHHHLMFNGQPTIDFNGFLMVFRFFSTMVIDGLKTPTLQKVHKFKVCEFDKFKVCEFDKFSLQKSCLLLNAL